MNFHISPHAQEECIRRQIPLDIVQTVLEHPDQIIPAHGTRLAYQAKLNFGDKVYLVRVIVDPNEDPAVAITVYRTSKIEKYWSGE